MWALGIFVTCLACFILSLAVLFNVRPDKPIVIKAARHVPADLMNYSLPYVVSFMSIDYQDTSKFVGFAIFLLWMFWITHRSGQIILNPIFIAFGWRPYELDFRYAGDIIEYSGMALVQGHVSPNETHQYVSLQDVLIIRSPL
jgi:hypothetical protein